MRDWYELKKKGIGNSEPFVFDECNLVSIIKMTKTRNKTLHKQLVKWFLKVNPESKVKKSKFGLEKILEGIEEIGRF